ncbi:SSI family serine proteinase inhibitor [Streptomyces sp. PU-14G]|uniref:SSI family serine proteinase inhibitor n=1 Tax=Streptomyces sp. PU-14G TaxID=2800808 RepID=UPI0034DF6FB8
MPRRISLTPAAPMSTAAALLFLAGTLAGAPVVAPEASAAEASAAEASAAARSVDELTFTVSDSGTSHDGSYTLRCHPAGGEHPSPRQACAALDRATSGGRNPFAPVSADATCTLIYGGPATARVTGTWHGRDVNARFKRANGCEVDRWNSLVPALPRTA